MITLAHQGLQVGGRNPVSLMSLFSAVGVASNLAFVLDAGDINSYAGGGSQNWLDLSGSNNHFVRGLTTGVGSADFDPTFFGTAGALSNNEYFGAVSTSVLAPAGAATFADTWHKSGGKFSMLFVGWSIAGSTLMGNTASTNLGVQLSVVGTRTTRLRTATSNVPALQTLTSTGAAPASTLCTIMASRDDAGLVTVKTDSAAFETVAATASSATSAPGSTKFAIYGDGIETGFATSPNRIYAAAAWNGLALTGAQMDSLRQALKDSRWTSLT